MRKPVYKDISPIAVLEVMGLLGLSGIAASAALLKWQLAFGVVGALLLTGAVVGFLLRRPRG